MYLLVRVGMVNAIDGDRCHEVDKAVVVVIVPLSNERAGVETLKEVVYIELNSD